MNPRRKVERPWPPTKFLRFESLVASNAAPAIVWTDAGRAYIKPLGGNTNPHSLAIELVCTKLAAWFGLPVLEHCVLDLDTAVQVPRPGGTFAAPGPCFCTRAVDAVTWDRSAAALQELANSDDIGRLVIFDTWVRNEDRFPPRSSSGRRLSARRSNLGNVLLAREGPGKDKLLLVAMDFGEAITRGREISKNLLGIDATKCEAVYGLFPEFQPHVTPLVVHACLERFKQLFRDHLATVVATIPPAWGVNAGQQTLLCQHLYSRAMYLVESLTARLAPLCYPQGRLPGI